MFVKSILLLIVFFIGFYANLFFEYPISINPFSIGELESHILHQIRLPRVLVSFSAGASLAGSDA